mgnify:CR=1 FL=1
MPRFPFTRRKESPIATPTLAYYGGRPQYRATDIDAYIREGYMNNPDVFSAVEIFSNAAGAVDWGVEKKVRGKWEPIDTHPMLDLLERPSPRMSGTTLIRELVKWRLIGGEFYLARNEKPSGPPRELYVLKVQRMKILPGRSPVDPVEGYEYQIGSQKTTMAASDVLHLPRFNPIDDWYGFSPLEAAARFIDQANSAADFNLGLLQNGGIPPGFLTSDEEVSDKAFARLKKAMRSWGMSSQSGKPQLLEAGLKYQAAGRSPADMEMLEAQRMFALKFAQVINIPAEFLSGAGEKKYNNASEAHRVLYTVGVLPELDDVRDALNWWLAPMFGDDVRLVYLTDSIDALQEDEDKRWERAENASDLTIDEKRAIKGFEKLPNGLGDVILVPFSMAPLGAATEPTTPPADGGEGEPPAEDPEDDPEPSSSGEKRIKSTNATKELQWKRVDAQRGKLLSRARSTAETRLKAETTAVVKAIKDAPTPPALIARANKAIDAGKKDWAIMLEAMALQIAEPFAEQAIRDLGGAEKSKALTDWRDGVLAYVRKATAAKVTRVTDTTKNDIKRIVEQGVNDGLSTYDIGQLIEAQQLDQIIPRRSEVIARTEIVQASNAGSVAGAKSTGLDLRKEWISNRGPNTREAHADADGETVGMDELFIINGDELEFPGDSANGAEAGNVIQCECTVGYVPA